MYNPSLDTVKQIAHNPWYKQTSERISEKATPANLVGLLGAIFALACLLGLHDPQGWNIRLPLYLIAVIWTLIRPRIALYLLPLAIPWGSLDQIYGLSSADILLVLLTASWLLSYTLRPLAVRATRQSGPLDYADQAIPRYLALAMFILLLTMLISLTVAGSLSASFKELVKWGEVLVVLLLGSRYLRTRRQIWTLVIIICIAGVSQACYGYTQYFLNLGPTNFVRDAGLRVYGTFGQPNPYAGYINMTLALACALLLLGRNWATRILAACVVIPLAGVEVLSQSKGGWLAISMALLFILIAGFPRLRGLIGAVLIALLGIIAAYLAGKVPATLIDPILTKIGVINISFTTPSTDNYANSERVAHWVAGVEMFKAHPFFGVGIGNYEYAYPHYSQGIFVIPLGHAHNYYINIAAEAGLLGLAAFVLFLVAAFVAGGHALRTINARYQQDKKHRLKPHAGITTIEAFMASRHSGILVNDRALAVGLMAAIISVCVHNLVDNLFVHGMAALFALLLVLLIRLEGVA